MLLNMQKASILPQKEKTNKQTTGNGDGLGAEMIKKWQNADNWGWMTWGAVLLLGLLFVC